MFNTELLVVQFHFDSSFCVSEWHEWTEHVELIDNSNLSETIVIWTNNLSGFFDWLTEIKLFEMRMLSQIVSDVFWCSYGNLGIFFWIHWF